jgi:BolA protein
MRGMSRIERIRTLLQSRFAPSKLEVIDESHRHAGHAGAAPGGETHVRVEIESAAFDGRSPLEIHRAVNDALKAEFEGGLHALVIRGRGTGAQG